MEKDIILIQIEKELLSSKDDKFKEKLHKVKYMLEGHSKQECIEKFGARKPTIDRYLRIVRAYGIDELRSKKKTGRKPKLDEKIKEDIEKILEEHPSDKGYAESHWNGRILADYIERYHEVSITERLAQTLIRDIIFRPVVGKESFNTMDDEIECFEERIDSYREDKGCEVWFIGGFQANRSKPSKKGERKVRIVKRDICLYAVNKNKQIIKIDMLPREDDLFLNTINGFISKLPKNKRHIFVMKKNALNIRLLRLFEGNPVYEELESFQVLFYPYQYQDDLNTNIKDVSIMFVSEYRKKNKVYSISTAAISQLKVELRAALTFGNNNKE